MRGSGDNFLRSNPVRADPVGKSFVNELLAAVAAAAAAAAVQADGQTAHWLHGENDSRECLHVCFPQSEKQPSLTHLPSSLTLCGCPKGRA